MRVVPPAPVRRRIDDIVRYYKTPAVQELVSRFSNVMYGHLRESHLLTPYIHFIKARVKEPTHLRDKLVRKWDEARKAKRPFDITPENLTTKITDLAGVRILHLRTNQIEAIDRGIREIIRREKFRLKEKPFARTWDDEYRAYFRAHGFKTEASLSMYTSVHYVVSSASADRATCEVQVRTLMEEVWGEVDHEINYPHMTRSLACKEQIRVLARVTSSATRLVDSLFVSWDEHRRRGRRRRRP